MRHRFASSDFVVIDAHPEAATAHSARQRAVLACAIKPVVKGRGSELFISVRHHLRRRQAAAQAKSNARTFQ